MMKAKMTKCAGGYYYCGYSIGRNDSISPGYFGRWYIQATRNGSCSSLKEARKEIDEKIFEAGRRAARENQDLPEECYPEFERGWREEVRLICMRVDLSEYSRKMAKQVGLIK